MTAELNFRVCRGCYKEIDRRARKCPYCQSYQGKFAFFVFAGMAGVVAALILILIGTVVFLHTLEYRLKHPSAPKNHAEQVVVKESRTVEVEGIRYDGAHAGRAVVGSLENRGPLSLKSIRLEIQFFNSKGELIDIVESVIYGPLVPGEKRSFKSSASSVTPRNVISSHEVVVRQAVPIDE